MSRRSKGAKGGMKKEINPHTGRTVYTAKGINQMMQHLPQPSLSVSSKIGKLSC